MSEFVPTPAERIAQLRRNLVVHSTLYYVLSTPIWTDFEFDDRAYELVRLQADHPEISKAVAYEYQAYKDFDGSTGFDLPIWTAEARSKAQYVYELWKRFESKPSEGEL